MKPSETVVFSYEAFQEEMRQRLEEKRQGGNISWGRWAKELPSVDGGVGTAVRDVSYATRRSAALASCCAWRIAPGTSRTPSIFGTGARSV